MVMMILGISFTIIAALLLIISIFLGIEILIVMNILNIFAGIWIVGLGWRYGNG